MINKIQEIFSIPELKRRVLFTLTLLIVYRIGSHITTPGVDATVLTVLGHEALEIVIRIAAVAAGVDAATRQQALPSPGAHRVGMHAEKLGRPTLVTLSCTQRLTNRYTAQARQVGKGQGRIREPRIAIAIGQLRLAIQYVGLLDDVR